MSANSLADFRMVAYYRKSDEDDGVSVEQQREWGRDIAAPKEGFTIVREFTDQARSGWKTSKRDEFHAMLAFCQEEATAGRRIDGILCWDPDRFSRSDSQETDWYLWEYRKVGTGRMYSSTRGWTDFERAEDRMVFGIRQEAGAHAQVKGLAQTVLRGRLKAAREGRYMNGAATFGYVSVPRPGGGKRLALADDVTVRWARWMFPRFLEADGSLDGIARELTRAGIPTPRGKAVWTPRTVRLILSRETYLGRLAWGKNVTGKFAGVVGFEVKERERGTGGEHTAKRREDWIEHDGTHEALVDPETFEKVQKKLAALPRTTRPRSSYPLTGLVVCGDCGKRMHGSTTHRHLKSGTTYYRRYLCQTYCEAGGCHFNSVVADDLLRAVVKRLQETAFREDKIRAAIAEIRRQDAEALKAAPGDVGRLRDRVKKLKGKVEAAERRFVKEEDESYWPQLRQEANELRGQYACAAEELAALERKQQPSAGVDLDALAEQAVQTGLRLKAAMEAGRLGAVREMIEVATEKIDLIFSHAPSRHGKRTRVKFVRGLIHVREGFPLSGRRYSFSSLYQSPDNDFIVIYPSDLVREAS